MIFVGFVKLDLFGRHMPIFVVPRTCIVVSLLKFYVAFVCVTVFNRICLILKK
jgi:hypothetical protein